MLAHILRTPAHRERVDEGNEIVDLAGVELLLRTLETRPRQAVRAFNDPPYTIVRTQVPERVLARPGISATVDRGIPAYVLPEEALPGLPYEILNYSPVPR